MALTKPPKVQGRGGPLAAVFRLLIGVVLVALMGGFLWALSVAGGIDAAETVDPAFTAPGRLVPVGDLTLHLREEGRPGQPAVLFLHDFDVNGGRQWLPLQESLDGYYRLMPDMVDFGYSTRLGDVGRPHTVVGRAEATIDLLNVLQIEEVHLVGAGLGGVVAAQVAALQPDLVVGLVMIAPEMYGPAPKWHEQLRSWPLIGEAYNFTFFGASSSAARRYAAGCEEGGWCPDDTTRAEREVTSRVRGTTEAFTAFSATPAATTLPGALSSIIAPTLILWGERDQLTPLSEGETLAGAIASATLTIVPGTGHRPHLEDPVVTGQFIGEFLGG
ncbi:MAG TPA: alpha/beta hydrolase [Acidimicrobiia bacterium]|nr:alpha/beta hydrolase [Acidimicrobiia bacterium]